MNDIEMMAIFIRDDEEGYRLLIDRYAAYVTAVISGIAKGSLTVSDIEEVASNVFFKIWRNKRNIHAPRLKAYIAKVARNAAIDRLRLNETPCVPYEDDVLQVAYHEQPDELTLLREQKEAVEQAVKSFKEPDREIFIRFYFFGETLKAISEKLGLNADTTKTKLRRSRFKVRDILQERGYGYE